MKKRYFYLGLTIVLSVLFGIILPLALGAKDFVGIALILVLSGGFMR